MKTLETRSETMAARALEHVNWTGLSLFQLIDAGRVYGEREIMGFVQAACGKAADLEELRDQREAVRIIGKRFDII